MAVIEPTLGTGDEFVGHRIETLLGRGGMGIVYLVEHIHLRQRRALKILRPELAQDEAFRRRFIRESRLAAQVEHPNIVPIYDAGESEGQLYISMRYIAGSDLKTLIDEAGTLDPSLAVNLLSQVAEALDIAHEGGLVHRDVKPANILIHSDLRGQSHVYLSDFGLTKSISSNSRLTQSGLFVGTLDYAPPEQCRGEELDARADVYALGCVLYECLTGEVPFPREFEVAIITAHLYDDPPRPSARWPELPAGIDDVIVKAMAKSPAARHATCRELMNSARVELLGEDAGASLVNPTIVQRPYSGWVKARTTKSTVRAKVPPAEPAAARPSVHRSVPSWAGPLVAVLGGLVVLVGVFLPLRLTYNGPTTTWGDPTAYLKVEPIGLGLLAILVAATLSRTTKKWLIGAGLLLGLGVGSIFTRASTTLVRREHAVFSYPGWAVLLAGSLLIIAAGLIVYFAIRGRDIEDRLSATSRTLLIGKMLIVAGIGLRTSSLFILDEWSNSPESEGSPGLGATAVVTVVVLVSFLLRTVRGRIEALVTVGFAIGFGVVTLLRAMRWVIPAVINDSAGILPKSHPQARQTLFLLICAITALSAAAVLSSATSFSDRKTYAVGRNGASSSRRGR